MNVVLWIVQILLALAYLGAGFMKSTKPKEQLYSSGMKFVEDFSATQVKLIGVVEVLGAIGLILPWALNILPTLTPLAALGLVLVQVGAIVVHIRRGESSSLPINAVLLLMAAFVAWGRFSGAM